MSESDSFLHEVSEEVRRDQLVAVLRKNAVWIALAVVVIVGGAAYFEWSKARATAEAQANGTKLWDSLQEEDAAARAEAVAALDLSPEAQQVAALQAAAALVESGDVQGAVTRLQALATDPKVSEPLKDTVRLKLVAISADVLEDGARLDLLERLMTEGHALRPLALEQRALIRLRDGDSAGAEADLRAIIDDPLGFDTVRARADQLLTAMGAGSAAEEG